MKPFPVIFTFLFLLFCACNRGGSKQETTAALTKFRGFPPAIEGCSCYFSPSEKDFSKEQYLFVSDLDSLAYIGINGKMTKMRLIGSNAIPNARGEKDYEETFSNGYYQVLLQIHTKGSSGDEVWENEGMMKLLFKDNVIDSAAFVGECGC